MFIRENIPGAALKKIIKITFCARAGLIHGDLSDLNATITSKQLAVDATEPEEIKRAFGAFDFEDCHFGYYVFELSICMMYTIAHALRCGSDHPWRLGGRVLAGYNKLLPLTEVELEVLYTAVAVRFCVSLVMSYTHPPETLGGNPELFFQSRWCEPLLRDMHAKKGREEIVAMWMEELQ